MSMYVKVRKYGRKGLLGIIVLTMVGSIVWYRKVTGERDGAEVIPSADPVGSDAQMITRDFRHVETRLNRTLWILEAAVAEVFENQARLQRVKVTWYGQGEEPVIVTGRRARVDLDSWNAVILGDVRAVTRDGAVLKTRQLEWDNNRKTLRAPWPVKIRSRNFDIQGRMMEAHAEEKWVRVSGHVKSVVRPPAGFLEPAT